MYRMANELFKDARTDAKRGCYAKSFDEYLTVLDKHPEMKFGIESEFRVVLQKLNKHLLKKNNMQEIFFNFQRATLAYPDDADILTDLGKYLFDSNHISDSCRQFHKALTINAGLVLPEKYLNTSKALIIPRRLFRIHNDKIKNDAYYEGIMQTVIPHIDKVLDIGSVSGLLSLYAMEREPREIVACEASYLFADIARSNFEVYKCDAVVVQKSPMDTTWDDTNGRSSLLLTQSFDAAVIGEHVLEVLEHAWLNLLEHNAKVLPQTATFYVAAARCDVLSAKYRVQSADMLKMLGIPGENVHVTLPDKTYDSDNLRFYNSIEYVAEPAALMTFDFNSLADIKKKHYNMERYKVSLEVKKYEEVNVIIGWFDLQIAEGINLTTNPQSDNCVTAWQQPIFYNFIPKSVKPGDTIDLEFSIFRNNITLLQDINEIMRVSRDMIRFLNDLEYTRILKKCIPSKFIYLTELYPYYDLNVMDMNPFPLFGFSMMKRGARFLTCYATTQEDKQFIMDVFMRNNISADRIQVLTSEKLNDKFLKSTKYHLIVANLLQVNGDMNSSLKLFIENVRQTRFAYPGVFIPKRVTLQGQLIMSEWIDKNHVIDSENMRCDVGTLMDKSQVTQIFDVDVPHLKYIPMSNPYDLGVCSETMESRIFRMHVFAKGHVNGLLCWYKIHIDDDDDEFNTLRRFSYVDSTIFRIFPPLCFLSCRSLSVTRCVDAEQNYKFIIDNV